MLQHPVLAKQANLINHRDSTQYLTIETTVRRQKGVENVVQAKASFLISFEFLLVLQLTTPSYHLNWIQLSPAFFICLCYQSHSAHTKYGSSSLLLPPPSGFSPRPSTGLSKMYDESGWTFCVLVCSLSCLRQIIPWRFDSSCGWIINKVFKSRESLRVGSANHEESA